MNDSDLFIKLYFDRLNYRKSRLRKKVLSIIFHLLLIIIFVINNWLMDISTWFRDDLNCSYNGLIEVCNQYLMYHLNWYISISIAIYFMIYTIVRISEVRISED